MDEKPPVISVVIPCFRAGTLLSEAIESVLSQTETDWELILVDNNASEETKAVIEKYTAKYSQKIKTIYERTQGSSSSRNRGLSESRGSYVAFLDDDDLMYPERLTLQKTALENNPDAVLCFGAIDWVSYDDLTILEKNAKDGDFPFFFSSASSVGSEARLRFPEPRPSSIMVCKEVALKIGGFDEHFNPVLLEETEFYFRLFQVGTYVTIPQPVIRFRMPSLEFLKKKRIDNVRKFRLLLNQDYFFSKVKKFLEEKQLLDNPMIRRDLSRMKARWLREISFDFMATPGGERFARLLLKRAIREAPSDLKSVKHLIRSFYPFQFRERRYRSQQVYEEGIPKEITEDFLLSLFEGDHHCPFCEASAQASSNPELGLGSTQKKESPAGGLR